MTSDAATTISQEGFNKLPRGAQLVIAYALVNDQWELQLLRTDRDAIALVEAGWLVVKDSTLHGIANCQFPDNVWVAMEAIESVIFDRVSERELERFVERKGKEYPWLW